MKRFLNKYAYLFPALLLGVFMSGCNMPFGNNAEENMLLTDEVLAPPISATTEETKSEKKEEEKKEVEQEEGLDLSAKNAVFDIDAGGRKTPFVPYRERNLTYSSLNFGDLPLPPGSGEMDEVLSELITAKVTGILYDDASPSAIINVLGDDYLVKPGDIVESFEIENISKDYVAIKTGSNIYRAKVGDIVDGDVYGTGVYNLGHRFAGTYAPANEEDILIVETKRNKKDEKQKNTGLKDLTLPPAPEIKTKISESDIPLPPSSN